MWKGLFGRGQQQQTNNNNGDRKIEDATSSSTFSNVAPPPPDSVSTQNASYGGNPQQRLLNFRPNETAQLERQVSEKARELADGVQSIVLQAKQQQQQQQQPQPSEAPKVVWKDRLLQLLGPSGPTDLLVKQIKVVPNFVSRCIEQELPPNLVHCLRLLRVLELQHAAAGAPNGEAAAGPATRRVSRLLTALCTTPTAGEQLQTHLFGLLALSGASYPPSGLAVALAASSVISALAQHCLTPSLVWYIHDRKMLFHMTDDIKDLMATDDDEEENGLLGAAAEQAGLWSIAFKTVLTLVHYSTQHGAALWQDFATAGGLPVYQAALEQSKAPHGKELVELLPLLICCRESDEEPVDLKLAQNWKALELLQWLLQKSNPLLLANTDNKEYSFPDALGPLASLSLELHRNPANKVASPFAFDVAGELLSATLQLFSEHPENYQLLEGSMHILSFYLLALPLLPMDNKIFALKSLEFVLTGVGVADELTPIHACVEVFLALIHALIDGADKELTEDATLMGSTLEKWLQFDQRVAPLLVESGILTHRLDDLLGVLQQQGKGGNEDSLDEALEIITRVWKLLVAHQPTTGDSNLHKFLDVCTNNLGVRSCKAVASVFEAYMASLASMDVLQGDMKFVSDLLIQCQDQPDRQVILLHLLRNVMEARGLAREAFLRCEGFDKLLQIISSSTAIPQVLPAVLNLMEASLGIRSRTSEAPLVSSLFIHLDQVLVDPASSRLSALTPGMKNLRYLRRVNYYKALAERLKAEPLDAVVDMAMGHMGIQPKEMLKNPDAIRFVISLLVQQPEDQDVSSYVQRLLKLCDNRSILAQIAAVGLMDLTTKDGRIQKLSTRIAGFRISYQDFLILLRNCAGPLLQSEHRIRLPVISGSSAAKRSKRLLPNEEEQVLDRLRALVQVASHTSKATPRLSLGGDTINSIAVLKHQVPLPERLKSVAEEGRLHYMEIEKLDVSAEDQTESHLDSTGFSFSLWLRHDNEPSNSSNQGNMYIFDISSIDGPAPVYLTVWYSVVEQCFTVISSARSESICFPASPLLPGVWHHILLTYTPAKRSMMSRKSVVGLYVDGRALEVEVRVDFVALPARSKVIMGAPNAALAVSGIIRGAISKWEMGNCLLLSTILLDFDATGIYCHGPNFPGLLWGDRPQHTSLAATATSTFVQLAQISEPGSLASALRRRDIVKMERVEYLPTKHRFLKKNRTDNLNSLHLYCQIPSEVLVFAFQPSTAQPAKRVRLLNLAKVALENNISSDAAVLGRDCLIRPMSFGDAIQWVGGPEVLMPLIHASQSSEMLALSLNLIREACRNHIPNLSRLQSGGVYRVLGVLLLEKNSVDVSCMDQCLAFAIHGYVTGVEQPHANPLAWTHWVLQDLDAMKHLLLNHKVWDLRKYGPAVSLRLLKALNLLVDHRALHKASNARRLHLVGIVEWTIHLMIEACELYMSDKEKAWICESPLVTDVTVGGDPGNPFLLECKNLLRRVLTFMLTPDDLGALAQATVYTVNIAKNFVGSKKGDEAADKRMLPSAIMRLHLVRLMEELIVDGVNEIVASHTMNTGKSDRGRDAVFQPHSGGAASPGQPYFSTPNKRGLMADGVTQHPKHQQAQAFLAAFSGFLTPVWFATLLEGGREEASVAATFRLMILLLQGSSSFESSFDQMGGFTPFVLSVPRFSTAPGLGIAMLSQLLNVPILHLHSLPFLDPEQLCELFDAEGDDDVEIPLAADPTSSIFALLSECLGRNIKIVAAGEDLANRASDTNQAIFHLLLHRFEVSPPFRRYCTQRPFCVPLGQTLCSIIGQQKKFSLTPIKSLSDVPKGLTPTERYVGGSQDRHSEGMGLVRLMRRLLLLSVQENLGAANTSVLSLFRSFPIHATPQQVEAFHLVVLEHCCFVIEKVMEEGGVIAVANCVGACSVLLEMLVQGYFSSEAAMKSLKAVTGLLDKLVKYETTAVHMLGNAEHAFMTQDAAHIANLHVAAALHASVTTRPYMSKGDEDLQLAILQILTENIEFFLLVPSTDRRKSRRIPTSKFPRPLPGTKMHGLWQSTSFARTDSGNYPDLASAERPDIAATAPLLVVVYQLLLDGRDDIRALAINVLVSLLKYQGKVMSELLVAQVQQPDGSVDRIDVVNRGGFRALLEAHEAAGGGSGTPQSLKRRYKSFFDWLERQSNEVDLVFESVQHLSAEMFPSLRKTSKLQVEAVESEQKRMLLKLTTEDSDRTFIGGVQRTELLKHCNEKTSENHTRWKRQGFDDLAFGAMALKTIMRRLKGAFGVWEGDQVPLRLAKHWKLDLTEGYERQRRRLLPNHEFHDLYNLDENFEKSAVGKNMSLEDAGPAEKDEEVKEESEPDKVVTMEATAELLKDLNIKRAQHREESVDWDLELDGEDGTAATDATSVSAMSASDGGNEAGKDKNGEEVNEDAEEEKDDDGPGNDDSYELVEGLIEKRDWPLKSYNVERCTGLEVTKALFLFCQEAVYVMDGFEQVDGHKISRVEKEQSTYHVSLRPKDFTASEEEDEELADLARTVDQKAGKSKATKKPQGDMTSDVLHQHRSQRIEFAQLHSIFRRRYQLQQNALEFFDSNKNATLIAFSSHEAREEVLSKILANDLHPESIFSVFGSTNYAKTMANYKRKIVSDWVRGQMTNFDFLMHLNTFAGRSFNDLTQYPVFPWIIADYESEELDLSDPETYRDLSKTMGGLGADRALQFRERYEALASTYFGEDDPPPFHYGTHFSSAAYTLYYLMRLEPFSRLALALQGGRFDVADRLFHDIGRSWKSASSENLQDVRELIPEFFYLPDFLTNTNGFDFGITQRGKAVHHVTLPKWAKGSPERFVKINRQALESSYVSQNLHLWADLVFGYKQRSVEDLNVFVHVTYEGEVDLESMEDPIQRASTIAQIQNFGQTPSRLEKRPFPQRQAACVVKDSMFDFGTFPQLVTRTPPFCVVGAPHIAQLVHVSSDTVRLGLSGQKDRGAGDLFMVKGQPMGVGRFCSMIASQKKYIRFGSLTNGISMHNATVSIRSRENSLVSLHDGLHGMPITVAKATARGDWIVTGCVDSTVRVWRHRSGCLEYKAVLAGHDGYPISCIDLCEENNVIVTGSQQGRVLLWDLRTLTFVQFLSEGEGQSVTSLSINHKTGNIVVLTGSQLRIYNINGSMLGCHMEFDMSPTCAIATNCADWMDDGIAAVTGHVSGEVILWSLNQDDQTFLARHKLENNPHTDPITCLRATGDARQDHLLVGDAGGNISSWKVLQLETVDMSELVPIVEQVVQNKAYT